MVVRILTLSMTAKLHHCAFFMHAIVCITRVYMYMWVFVYPELCMCAYVCLCGGSSHCSTLYKHISWADSAQREGESASRQPGTEAS